MENIFVLSSRTQLLDSLRRSLVYANPLSLSFRFYSDLESMLADITMAYKPRAILIDQNGTDFSLPSSLQSIAFNLVEQPTQHEREVLIYQNMNGFIDDVIALTGSSFSKEIEMTDGPMCIWLLDPEEKDGRQEIMETVMRSAKRKGIKPIISDCSKWGDALTAVENTKSQCLSELLGHYACGHGYDNQPYPNQAEILTGMDHPMDSVYLTQDFLGELWGSRMSKKSHVFIYSGFLESSAMIFLTAHSHKVWYFENSRRNSSRVFKEEKIINWIEANNKKIQIEKIKSDGNEHLRIEALLNNCW